MEWISQNCMTSIEKREQSWPIAVHVAGLRIASSVANFQKLPTIDPTLPSKLADRLPRQFSQVLNQFSVDSVFFSALLQSQLQLIQSFPRSPVSRSLNLQMGHTGNH